VRFKVLKITVFGMWHCIIWYIFTGVLEDAADSILRIPSILKIVAMLSFEKLVNGSTIKLLHEFLTVYSSDV
jgi:hypothetical protein